MKNNTKHKLSAKASKSVKSDEMVGEAGARVSPSTEDDEAAGSQNQTSNDTVGDDEDQM